MNPNESKIVVKCYACNGELLTRYSQLRSGERSRCPNCKTDLKPTHTDPNCGFCQGLGAAKITAYGNTSIWICVMGGRPEWERHEKPD